MQKPKSVLGVLGPFWHVKTTPSLLHKQVNGQFGLLLIVYILVGLELFAVYLYVSQVVGRACEL